MAAKKKTPVNGWDPNWLLKNAPAGVVIPGAGTAHGPGSATLSALPAPPVGTYDPSIDYNAGASQRGYQNSSNDAQTAYEQGQEDLRNTLGQLGTQHQNTLTDLLTGKTRSDQDYTTATQDLAHQYGILGHQQAEHAAQQGITSAGLLTQSNAVRGANQTHDQTGLDTTHNRAVEDYNTNVGRENQGYTDAQNQLNLQNARQFGGFNGNILTDPYTGQSVVGSLATNLSRAGTENTAYQTAAGQQRIYGAQQMGYTAPVAYTFTSPIQAASATTPAKKKTTGLLATSANPYATVRTP